MAKQKMTTKRKMTPAQKYERLDRKYSDFTAGAISIDHAWLGFMVEQEAKGNSKATLDYYRRFFKKLKAFTATLEQDGAEPPVELLEMDGIQICANCPTRELCTKSKDFVKTVMRHIWKPYVELADELRYTERHKRYYKMRKETIERVFADAMEKHGVRYTIYTGLAQVTNWVRLKFAAMNLKKFAIRKWEDAHNLLQILIFWPRYAHFV